jgi:hypothetical protein
MLAKILPKEFEQNLASPFSNDQLSEEVVYITQKLLDWLDSEEYSL